MNEGFLWHIVASHLSPTTLLICAEVSHSWFAWARTDGSWKVNVQRIIAAFPELEVLFSRFKSTAPEGLRCAEPTRKRRKSFASPRGHWYVFAHYLNHPILKTGTKNMLDHCWRILIKCALDQWYCVNTICGSSLTKPGLARSEIRWKKSSFVYQRHCPFTIHTCSLQCGKLYIEYTYFRDFYFADAVMVERLKDALFNSLHQ